MSESCFVGPPNSPSTSVDSLPERPVMPRQHAAELREQLVVELPKRERIRSAVIEHLAAAGGSADGRHGRAPLLRIRDRRLAPAGGGRRLADQCLGPERRHLPVAGPAASVVEEVAATWLLELLDLPHTASVGFVTGAQMANFTCLAAARHAVLERVGWDVEGARAVRERPRSRSSSARRRMPPSTPRSATSAWAANEMSASRPTTRDAWRWMRSRPGWRGSTGRSSSACRPAM